MDTLNKNLEAIRKKKPELADEIFNAAQNNDYAFLETSKTNQAIPVFNSGHLMYSKYNPEREVSNLFQTDDEFILFCGIGSGLQIKYFLENFPQNSCAITDISLESLRSLFTLVDLTEILNSTRVRILPPVFHTKFYVELTKNYLPVLDGKLRLVSLRSWKNFYEKSLPEIKAIIFGVLTSIETDFATQAVFGKVWLKNILQNLQLASFFQPQIPKIDTKKTALICGAGPSLTEKIPYIKSKRKDFIIFATDTSFLPLIKNGIKADFFLSVDPQIFSAQHLGSQITKNIFGVFDLCALNQLPRRFFQNGNKLLFTASLHPLSQYACAISPLPHAESSSGTVAIYALDVAHRLGFERFETAGLDFCYAGGKPYANGTYLTVQAVKTCNKLFSTETFFSKLMFRGKTEKALGEKSLDYKTAILNHYKNAANNYCFDGKVWKNSLISKFNYTRFVEQLINDLKLEKLDALTAMLPFRVFYKVQKKEFSLPLVINTIIKYNSSYE